MADLSPGCTGLKMLATDGTEPLANGSKLRRSILDGIPDGFAEVWAVRSTNLLSSPAISRA